MTYQQICPEYNMGDALQQLATYVLALRGLVSLGFHLRDIHKCYASHLFCADVDDPHLQRVG